MVSILISTLLSILGKLVSSDFITFLVLEGAKILAKKIDAKYDPSEKKAEEVVQKMSDILIPKKP